MDWPQPMGGRPQSAAHGLAVAHVPGDPPCRNFKELPPTPWPGRGADLGVSSWARVRMGGQRYRGALAKSSSTVGKKSPNSEDASLAPATRSDTPPRSRRARRAMQPTRTYRNTGRAERNIGDAPLCAA